MRHLCLLALRCVPSAVGVNHVTGYMGSKVEISCSYDKGYESYEKGNQPSTCLQDALITSNNRENGRFRLNDVKMSRIFTVTISSLTQSDSGHYLCGVQTNSDHDVFSAVELRVKVKTAGKTVPSTVKTAGKTVPSTVKTPGKTVPPTVENLVKTQTSSMKTLGKAQTQTSGQPVKGTVYTICVFQFINVVRSSMLSLHKLWLLLYFHGYSYSKSLGGECTSHQNDPKCKNSYGCVHQ
uniref:Immunoglobulin domain-containing protein n=1 Tax=Pundamilia nyererei TaxID=303518 RepID=A0A3B4F8N6_9CICH